MTKRTAQIVPVQGLSSYIDFEEVEFEDYGVHFKISDTRWAFFPHAQIKAVFFWDHEDEEVEGDD